MARRLRSSFSVFTVAPHALHEAMPVILATCDLPSPTINALSLTCKAFCYAARTQHPIKSATVQNVILHPDHWHRFCQHHPCIQNLSIRGVTIKSSDFAHALSLTQMQELELSCCRVVIENRVRTRGSAESSKVDWQDAMRMLASMSTLRSLKLCNCSGFHKADAAYISRMTWLHTLDLSHCKLSTCGATRHLSSLGGLKRLDLGRTDIADLPFLPALTSLTSLDLSYCALPQTKSLHLLSSCTNLQELLLGNCLAVGRCGVQFIGRLTNLRALDLSGAGGPAGEGLVHLTGLEALTRLGLSHKCFFRWEVALQYVGMLTGLKSLKLGDYLRADLGALCQLSGLKELQLLTFWGRYTYGGASLDPVWSLTNLCHLDLHGSAMDEVALSAVSRLTLLTQLVLGGNHKLGAVAMAHLSTLHNLRQLDLCKCQFIGAPALAYITHLTKLQCLHLCNCPGVDADALEMVAHLTGLQVLCLATCPAADTVALEHIAKLTNLRGLYLCENHSLEGRALRHISALTALEELDLKRCRGMNAKALRHVGKLRSLDFLNLSGCHDVDSLALAQLTTLHQLRILLLDNCPLLDATALQHLMKLKNLADLGLNECTAVSESSLATLRGISSLQELRYSCGGRWFERSISMHKCCHMGRKDRKVGRRLRAVFGVEGAGGVDSLWFESLLL